jgi:hypothetical protein
VSDIFREVEEEVRQERLQKWWKKYGNYIVAGASILIIGVAGWKLWERYDLQQRQKASADFEAASQMSQAGQADLAARSFATIAKTAPSGYAVVAQLAEADEMAAAGRTNEAVALYMKIAEKNHSGLGDMARMRAAWAQGDTLSSTELRTLLTPLNDGKSQWRFMARELLAYRTLRDGKTADSLKEYAAIAADSAAPQSVRDRAGAMATLIRTSGGRDFGTVPPPPPPVAPAAPNQGTATP